MRLAGTNIIVAALISAAVAGAAAAPALARAITVNETATVKIERDGTVVTGSGRATGTLPGKVSMRLTVKGLGVTGNVTLKPRTGGSLKLQVAASVTSNKGGVQVLSGTVRVLSGTGVYDDARGSGSVDAYLVTKSDIATIRGRDIRLTY